MSDSNPNESPEPAAPTEPPKRENVWLNLALNIIIPTVLLIKGANWFGIDPEDWYGQARLLVFSLAFPLCYGLYDFATRKKINFFSILGFFSILITGGVGLLGLPKEWVAIKEAAIPALFAVAVLSSLVTPFPLIRAFLLNPEIFDVPRIEAALDEKGKRFDFEKLMKTCTLLLAASFIVSAFLNYGLAKYMVTHDPDVDLAGYNKDMGRMTAWSYLVIMVPSMAIMMVALFKLANGIEDFTGFHLEDVMHIGKKDDDDEDKDEEDDQEGKPVDDPKEADSRGS